MKGIEFEFFIYFSLLNQRFQYFLFLFSLTFNKISNKIAALKKLLTSKEIKCEKGNKK